VHFKLSQAGFDVHTVEDGAAALSAIEDEPPALAILDVMMGGLSGVDVLRRIRENEQLRNVAVLLLTARARDADVDAGFEAGADDYVAKPFSPRELLHRVNSVLTRSR
jgi:DNA-binding response OmpR family regulator